MTPEENQGTKTDIKSMSFDELAAYTASIGEKPYRAGQLFDWIHGKCAASFDEMTTLSKTLREKLSKEASLQTAVPVRVLTSQKDGTKKYLFRLEDGSVIESVMMPYHHGNTVCISSQVGCAMGCRFCASTIGGKVRNLSAGEMLEQVYRIQALSGERVGGVVVMGTGEPLDNYDALVRFIRLITDKRGLDLSGRSVTVSTCGIVPGIRALAGEKLPVTLALSLHAPTQEKREKLMPVARRYDLESVLGACKEYFETTGRRVTFEYALVKGENDSSADAQALARLARPLGAHVNLIPVNPVKERNYRRPDRSHVEAFKNNLAKQGINATIRREMGADISGACGQLRRGYLDQIREDPLRPEEAEETV